MHILLKGTDAESKISWDRVLLEEDASDLVEIVYYWTVTKTCPYGNPQPPTRYFILEHFKSGVGASRTNWLSPRLVNWILDLDEFRSAFPEIAHLSWLHGQVVVEPEVEAAERRSRVAVRRTIQSHLGDQFAHSPLAPPHERHRWYECKVVFRIPREMVTAENAAQGVPLEIKESLENFRRDHPDPGKVAMVIMRFGESKAHENILDGLKYALNSHGIIAIRADEKQYHDDLFSNVATYMHGCGFAIAVYERIEEDTFNPNISMEVGYLMALRKPVCILKDRTLKTLHSDIMGKLYRQFDPHDPGGSIPSELAQWIKDKNLVA